jgi:lipoate-protein ligase B
VSEKICLVHRLGVIEYQEAWRLQERLAAEIAAGQRPATLLLLEHPHTYTFGRRGHIENLLWDENDLAQRGIAVHWVDRGGDVTYPGPGQLVGYPLLSLVASGLRLEASGNSLRLPQADYVGYVRRLEQTLILALAQLGVSAFQVEGKTGVWVETSPIERSADESEPTPQDSSPAKIAAIGVKVDVQGVTRHGFALNVNPDMSYWEGIVGCGLLGYPVTRLAEILQPLPGMDIVTDMVISAFARTYGFKITQEELPTS